MGLRQGIEVWDKWGYNTDVDSGSEETIWSIGGRIDPLTNATTLIISSNSANDIATTGTGARQVHIYGVSNTRIRLEEVVSMNGTSNVTTTNEFLGVNRMEVIESGNSWVNEGVINAVASSDYRPVAQIPLGHSVTQQMVFYTQQAVKALANSLFYNIIKIDALNKPTVILRGWIWDFDAHTRKEIMRWSIDTGIENSGELIPPIPLKIGQKSMLEITAETDINNTEVNIRMGITEFRDIDY